MTFGGLVFAFLLSVFPFVGLVILSVFLVYFDGFSVIFLLILVDFGVFLVYFGDFVYFGLWIFCLLGGFGWIWIGNLGWYNVIFVVCVL